MAGFEVITEGSDPEQPDILFFWRQE